MCNQITSVLNLCVIKVLFFLSLCFFQCVVRVCCIRSFGHFLTSLQGNVLHFNPEAGIFTSVSQSKQDNLVQQAKAQFRMVIDILVITQFKILKNLWCCVRVFLYDL